MHECPLCGWSGVAVDDGCQLVCADCGSEAIQPNPFDESHTSDQLPEVLSYV